MGKFHPEWLRFQGCVISLKTWDPYGDDLFVDRIDLKKIVEEVVGLEEITVSQDIDIVDDQDEEWVEDRSKPE